MAVNQVTKADIQALIHKTIMPGVIESAIKKSAVLPYMTRLPNMTSSTTQMSILDRLPLAYWQGSDTALKKTTSLAWKNKYLIAQELAVLCPFSINQVNDASVDIWTPVRARLEEAFHQKIDQAIITGFDKPSHFRMSLLDSAINAGAVVTRSANLRKDIIDAESYVLKSDYDPTTLIGSRESKGEIRLALTDSIGQPIIDPELDALNKVYVSNGSWDSTKAVLMVGDLSQCVYAFREDISFQIFDTGVISDPESGQVVINLMQQDMYCIRATMRFAWECPNPISIGAQDNTKRFPVAAIVPSDAPAGKKVTFTVKDSTAAAVEGALVIFAGAEKLTDAQGKAEFTIENESTSHYCVSYKDKQPVVGKVIVEGSDKEVPVVFQGE